MSSGDEGEKKKSTAGEVMTSRWTRGRPRAARDDVVPAVPRRGRRRDWAAERVAEEDDRSAGPPQTGAEVCTQTVRGS